MAERDRQYWKKIRTGARASQNYIYTVGSSSPRSSDPATARNNLGITLVREAMNDFQSDLKVGNAE